MVRKVLHRNLSLLLPNVTLGMGHNHLGFIYKMKWWRQILFRNLFSSLKFNITVTNIQMTETWLTEEMFIIFTV